MIVVVASVTDDAATELAARSGGDVVLLTPIDLCSPGWSIELDGPPGTLVAGGRRRHVDDLSGVVTRLVTIPQSEMLVLAPADRAYAVCEATAFMAWWLSTLTCPVINEPDPTSLVGRRRHPAEWAQLAARVGVPIHPSMHRTNGHALRADDVTWCTMIDGEPMSCAPPEIIEQAAALARLVHQRLIGFAFTTGAAELCAVSPIPPLADDDWQTLLESLR